MRYSRFLTYSHLCSLFFSCLCAGLCPEVAMLNMSLSLGVTSLVLFSCQCEPLLPEHTTLSAWKRCASCSTVSSLILCATATYWPRLYCTVIWFFVVLDSPRSLHQSPAQVSFKGWFLFFKKDCLHSWSLTCSVQWLFSLHALFLVLIIYIYLYLNSFFSLPLKGVLQTWFFLKMWQCQCEVLRCRDSPDICSI